MPELRVGGGPRSLFVYGMVAPGLGIGHLSVDVDAFGVDVREDETDVGFNLGLGVGAQVIVWRSLAVGLELGTGLGFYPEQGGDDFGSGSSGGYGAHTLDLELLVAWWF